MSAGGEACCPGLLLTLSWLLLAGLRAACGANDAAVQDPSLVREGAGADEAHDEGKTQSFSEADPEARAEMGQDGEGARCPGGCGGTSGGQALISVRGQ